MEAGEPCSAAFWRLPLPRRATSTRHTLLAPTCSVHVKGVKGFVSKRQAEQLQGAWDASSFSRSAAVRSFSGAFKEGDVAAELVAAAAAPRLTDAQWMTLVPRAALSGDLKTLFKLLGRRCPTPAALVATYTRLLKKVPEFHHETQAVTHVKTRYLMTPEEVFPDDETAAHVLRFIREFPGYCTSLISIRDGLYLTYKVSVSKDQLRRVINKYKRVFNKKTVHVSPKQQRASDIDSFMTYLDALQELRLRVEAESPGVVGDALLRKMAARMAFMDEAPVNEGTTVRSAYGEVGCPVQASGDRKGGGTRDKWIMSAVITVDKVIKAWLHVKENNTRVNVNTSEVEGFILSDKVPLSVTNAGAGGGAVGPLLQAAGVEFLFLDQAGRSGPALDPTGLHFSPRLLAHFAAHGVRAVLLPPGGCLANPIELFNGFLQRAVYSWMPDDTAEDMAANARRAPGVSTLQEAQTALHEAVLRLNTRSGSRDHLFNWYKQRAFGDDMWKAIRSLPLTRVVAELRAQRISAGLVVQRRPLFRVDDPVVFRLYDGTDGTVFSRITQQSLRESLEKPAAKRALTRFEHGGDRGNELFTLRPYLGGWRYDMALKAINVLVGLYYSKHLRELREALGVAAMAGGTGGPVARYLMSTINRLYSQFPPKRAGQGPSAAHMPKNFGMFGDVREGPYVHSDELARSSAATDAAVARGRATLEDVLPEPWKWDEDHVAAIVWEVRQLFPDRSQEARWFLVGEGYDIAQGPEPATEAKRHAKRHAKRQREAHKGKDTAASGKSKTKQKRG